MDGISKNVWVVEHALVSNHTCVKVLNPQKVDWDNAAAEQIVPVISPSDRLTTWNIVVFMNLSLTHTLTQTHTHTLTWTAMHCEMSMLFLYAQAQFCLPCVCLLMGSHKQSEPPAHKYFDSGSTNKWIDRFTQVVCFYFTVRWVFLKLSQRQSGKPVLRGREIASVKYRESFPYLMRMMSCTLFNPQE